MKPVVEGRGRDNQDYESTHEMDKREKETPLSPNTKGQHREDHRRD